MSVDPSFELKWYEIFQHWLFTTYFAEIQAVYEFGCGSGINLAALAKLYPEKRYFGLDWAAPSKEIVDEMAEAYGWDMKGHLFDFFAPDESLKVEEGGIVFTLGALEQTGQDYEAFLQYLLRWQPGLCVNIEPILEWYDENNLVDYAAIRFHRMRKYWEGFPNRLMELERADRVEVHKMKRSNFGSLFLEGYSQTIWRPTKKS
jgi:SAM-dependent methyltransferase